ncbi:MAG TPA: putative Ig domain-containing protein, partial [Paracoccaceae bacterium]|nr:putative Ig domain-containing protein [Paracoccaceae bacterium]
ILIATPDGTIRLADQVRRAVGHSRSNIERIVFSDGELDEAGIRARALSDPPPVAAPMAMMAMDVGDGEADGEEGGANMAVALTTGEPAPNGIPVLVAPLPDRIVTATGPFAITLQTGLFSDPDGDALTFSVTLADGGALPGWMAFDAATRTLSGEPPSGATAASVQLRLHASDGQAGISDDFTLRLNVANAAPVLDRPLEDVASQASGQPIRAGSPFRFDIDRAAFRDPDGDPLILSARLADGSPLPGWMVFDGTGFVGLPPAAAAGQIEIAVRATDGLLSVEDRFVLTVAPPPPAPDAAMPPADGTQAVTAPDLDPALAASLALAASDGGDRIDFAPGILMLQDPGPPGSVADASFGSRAWRSAFIAGDEILGIDQIEDGPDPGLPSGVLIDPDAQLAAFLSATQLAALDDDQLSLY